MDTNIEKFINTDLRNEGIIYQNCIISQIEYPYKDYVALLQNDSQYKSMLSASMIGSTVEVNGRKIESYFDNDINILKYCLGRIDEIEAINRFSHTPSAFSCILSFMAFLAQASHNSFENEGVHFKDFCKKHLKHLRCSRNGRNEKSLTQMNNKDSSWGGVLYRLVRCGLIHALSSQGNKDSNQNEVEIRLTHSTIEDGNADVVDFVDSTGVETSVLLSSYNAVTITINAFDLISAVRDSVLHIYTEGSDVKNMREYFKARPPLMAVIDAK